MSLTANQLVRLGKLIKAGLRPKDAAALADRVSDSDGGVAGGFATLDDTGNVPVGQLGHAPSSGGAVTSVAGKTGVVTLVKGDVALGNVDNTSDVNKPVSTAQATAIAAAGGAVTSVATRTGAVVLTKTDVGLSNVDNTSDVNKPVSTAQATAIAAAGGAVTSVATRTGAVVLTKTDVGLANVDNTSDVNKPVSTAQATAIAAGGVVTSVATRTGAVVLTKTDVGLANVDNVSDVNKPVSTAQATADGLRLAKASNLSDVASAATSRANIGATPLEKADFGYSGVLQTITGSTRWYVANACTWESGDLSAGTAPTGAAIIVDIKKNGTTIYTTSGNRPTLAAASQHQSSTTPDVTAFAAGDYVTVDIVQVGSTIVGSDMLYQLRLRRT